MGPTHNNQNCLWGPKKGGRLKSPQRDKLSNCSQNMPVSGIFIYHFVQMDFSDNTLPKLCNNYFTKANLNELRSKRFLTNL